MSSTDLVAILRSYLDRALRDVPGMKALLLDAETVRAVSTALSQSDILEREVYLVQRVDTTEGSRASTAPSTSSNGAAVESLPHLQAVAFLRPTRDNVARLRRELRNPRFGGYHLHFTNRLEDMRLQDLAEGDGREIVAGVYEAYGDFIALEAHHAAVPLPRPHLALAPMAWDFGTSTDMVERLTEGLASMALALRRRFVVRHQRGSEVAQRLAQSLHHLTTLEQRELFDFGARPGEAPPLVLILDRRDDPVTPLLSQWTYQAMIHEVLGSRDNRVALHPAGGVAARPETSEAVLSAAADPFYAKNMYANFGDVGMAVKLLVDAAAAEGRQARDFQSLDDMAAFVEGLPEATRQQGLTAKHVALMTELSHAVERRGLMSLSGVEQEIACAAPAPAAHYEAVASLVRSPGVAPADKARLVALYGLRYEREARGQAAALMTAAAEAGVDPALLGAVRTLLKHCGAEHRVADIFSDRSLTSRIATLAKQHLKGVENVYTQHVPPLVGILEKAVRGKLPEVDYPRADGGGGGFSSGSGVSGGGSAGPTPRLVVAFVVGGTTYEEAKAVAELNASADRGEGWAAGVRFLLAGTGPQSSSTFLEDWEEVALMERYHGNRSSMR